MSEETAEYCRLLRESSFSGYGNELKWFIAYYLLIYVSSILAQIELITSLKDSNSVPPTKWPSMKADATDTGPENSVMTDICGC
jgi:hypothetical protein